MSPKTSRPKKSEPVADTLKKQITQLEDDKKRLAAELVNIQRRAEAEHQTLLSRARTDLLEKLFPIIDNLERASHHAPTVELEHYNQLTEADYKHIYQYFAGLRLIEKQLANVLTQAGLERIATKGEVFNHHLHEAISYEPSRQVPADHIIDEVESGYQVNGRVVRVAKVRVSQG